MAKFQLINWLTSGIAAGDATNFWTSIQNFLSETKKNLVATSWGVFIVAAIVGGIMFAFGRSGSEIAKSLIGKIVIGVMIVSFAVAIISTIASMGGQTVTFK